MVSEAERRGRCPRVPAPRSKRISPAGSAAPPSPRAVVAGHRIGDEAPDRPVVSMRRRLRPGSDGEAFGAHTEATRFDTANDVSPPVARTGPELRARAGWPHRCRRGREEGARKRERSALPPPGGAIPVGLGAVRAPLRPGEARARQSTPPPQPRHLSCVASPS